MAFDTSKTLRNQVMYSVFVRNYSEEGTFEGVRKDLQRIKDLGVDIIQLMPIHPLGEKARKGTLGSPYAIKDYREVNPEFGTIEDLKRLVQDIITEKIPLYCPHGRPVIISLTQKEIERQFGRA